MSARVRSTYRLGEELRSLQLLLEETKHSLSLSADQLVYQERTLKERNAESQACLADQKRRLDSRSKELASLKVSVLLKSCQPI